MEVRDKLARIMRERNLNQQGLIRLVKAEAGQAIESSKMSELLSGVAGATAKFMVPLSITLDVSLDWWYDVDAKFPPMPRSGRGQVLSDAQSEVLKIAGRVSKHDGDPEAMETAIDLMMGVYVAKPSDVAAEHTAKPIRAAAKPRSGRRTG